MSRAGAGGLSFYEAHPTRPKMWGSVFMDQLRFSRQQDRAGPLHEACVDAQLVTPAGTRANN